MKQQRSYSDPEIARYVLGLDLPEQAQDIQTLLAHDDAAAARALKWEAYLLGIVDALPPTSPPDGVLEQIQQTLGMTSDAPVSGPVLGETRDRARPSPHPARRSPFWQDRLHRPKWLGEFSARWIKLTGGRRPSNRVLLIGAATGAVIVAIAALVIGASLHTTPRTVVHQVVTTQAH